MCYIHTVEYDLAIKKNKALIHVSTWMNLEKNIVLLGSTQKATQNRFVILFLLNVQNRQIHRDKKNRLVFTRDWEKREIGGDC